MTSATETKNNNKVKADTFIGTLEPPHLNFSANLNFSDCRIIKPKNYDEINRFITHVR